MGLSFITQKPAGTEPDSLRYRLHKALRNSRPGRSLANIHASDITDYSFCGRRRLIQRLKNLSPEVQWLSATDRATYDFGYAVQEAATEWFVEAGMAVGDWKCLHCGQFFALQYKPHTCDKCSHKHFDHIERRFASQVSGISGGIDLFISGMGPLLRTLEIKSMLKDQFVKLAGPLQEHKLRTNLYLRLIQESNDEDRHRIDPQVGHVLYICKGGYAKVPEVLEWKFGDSGFTPFKDYVVERDDSATDALVKQPRLYKEALETSTIPPGLCASQWDAPAKGCPVAQECFSGSFPIGKKFV